MKRIIIGVAALAAVAIPTTGFAVYGNEGEDLLDTIIIERIVIDAMAEDLCDAARGMAIGMTDVEAVDQAMALFEESFTDSEPALYVYVAGLVTGCLN